MATNQVGPTGATIQSLSDVLDELLNGAPGFPGLYAIYGADINVQPNSPDGNALNLYAQGKIDVLELVIQVYNSFDPDQAIGPALDARCAINGVVRQAGTYTQQIVAIVFSAVATLPGLNDFPNGGAFTVQDGTGNQYALLTTFTSSGAGTVDLAFQAVVLGAISSAPGTITTVVTSQVGVTSCTNAAGPTSVGLNEESDPTLRIRRANSVEQPSQGFSAGLKGGLLDIVGVTSALVLENDTSILDANNQVPHSLWVTVTGGDPVAICQEISVRRNAGCGQNNSGTGFTAHSVLSGSGVGSVVVDTPGTKFLKVTLIALVAQPGDPGTGATAHCTLSGTGIATVVVDTAGTGYLVPPFVVANPGTQQESIDQGDGSQKVIYFDRPVVNHLYFQAAVSAITGTVDLAFITAQILAEFGAGYQIGESADSSSIVAFIKSIAPNAWVYGEGVSLNGVTFTGIIGTTAVNAQITIPSSANIDLT